MLWVLSYQNDYFESKEVLKLPNKVQQRYNNLVKVTVEWYNMTWYNVVQSVMATPSKDKW